MNNKLFPIINLLEKIMKLEKAKIHEYIGI